MENEKGFDFGDHVQDKYSGFDGVVTGKAQYPSGEETVLVQGQKTEAPTDVRFPASTWINVKHLIHYKIG